MLAIYEVLLIGGWLAERNLLRRIRRESGDPIGAAQTDRKFVITLIVILLLLQLPVIRAGRWRETLPRDWWVVSLGVAITLTGIAIRLWAIRGLQENFSYVVNVGDKHRLVTTGLYRHIRHPAYTGLLLMLVGLMVVLCDAYFILAALLVAGAEILRRIHREERWLREQFGEEYVRWAARTKRLIPYFL